MKLRSKFLNVKLLVIPPKCFGSLFAMTVLSLFGSMTLSLPAMSLNFMSPGFTVIPANDGTPSFRLPRSSKSDCW